MSARGKRPCPDTEPFDDAFHSDGEHPVSGAAERKRELERNRRNLVNVRFAELEKELSNLPGAPIRMCRRIDKEVVLKDAAQRLSSQQRELVAAASRINTMVNEIETLRSEKLELRQDKAYLHKELEAVRREKKLLIRDTVILWQALRKAGGIKSVLSNEITRIPAQMLLHPALTQAALNGQAKALDAAMSLHKRQKTGEDSKDIISAPANLNGNTDVSGGDADNKSPSTTNGTKCSMGSESECTSGSSATPGVDGARGNGTVTNEFEKPQNGELEDTLRVLQTAEDMGDLLAAYGAAAESFLPLNAISQSNEVNYSGVDNAEGIDHRISSSFLRNAIDVAGRPLDFSGQYNFDQKEALYHSSGAGVGMEDQDPVPTDIAYCG